MLTLVVAQAIIAGALAQARQAESKPVAVVVADAGGAPVALAREDGCGTARCDLSLAKARSALALGIPTRALSSFFESSPALFTELRGAVGGALLPIAGGVLVRNAEGLVVGAVGISGGSLENEESFVITAITAAGLHADPAV
jgi:uncharacterized protein GlcG (DUF336 family)